MSTLSFGFVFILMIACFSANTSSYSIKGRPTEEYVATPEQNYEGTTDVTYTETTEKPCRLLCHLGKAKQKVVEATISAYNSTKDAVKKAGVKVKEVYHKKVEEHRARHNKDATEDEKSSQPGVPVYETTENERTDFYLGQEGDQKGSAQYPGIGNQNVGTSFSTGPVGNTVPTTGSSIGFSGQPFQFPGNQDQNSGIGFSSGSIPQSGFNTPDGQTFDFSSGASGQGLSPGFSQFPGTQDENAGVGFSSGSLSGLSSSDGTFIQGQSFGSASTQNIGSFSSDQTGFSTQSSGTEFSNSGNPSSAQFPDRTSSSSFIQSEVSQVFGQGQQGQTSEVSQVFGQGQQGQTSEVSQVFRQGQQGQTSNPQAPLFDQSRFIQDRKRFNDELISLSHTARSGFNPTDSLYETKSTAYSSGGPTDPNNPRKQSPEVEFVDSVITTVRKGVKGIKNIA